MKLRLRNLLFAILLCILGPCTAYPAWLFDGTNDYITMADNAALDLPSGNWTIAGWFNLTSTAYSGDDAYLFQHGASGSDSIRFALDTVDGINYNILHARFTGSVFVPVADEPDWTPNTNWNHVRIERNSNTVNIYLNGSLIATEDVTGLGGIAPSGSLYFSRNPGGSTDWFPGAMADWAKWDRVLTSGEAAALDNGFSASCVPGFAWFTPMINAYQELKSGIAVTNNGTVNTAHPRLYFCN